MTRRRTSIVLSLASIALLAPSLPSLSSSALAKSASKTASMPTVAPSFTSGRGGSGVSENASPGSVGSTADSVDAAFPDVNVNGQADQGIGHSTMMMKVKPPTLQGNAVRESTAGSALNKPLLEGNVLRQTAPDDAFAAAGMARTDVMLKKPKPARVEKDVYRAWVSKAHPQFSLKAESTDPTEVVEVKGQWDKADRTLKNLGIQHTTIGAGQLNPVILAKAKVLVINCAGKLERSSLQAIRDFVARGGYLLTTDWALDNMLRQTFPGYVDWNKGKSKGNVVDAHVVLPEREFFQGTVSNASWKLDEESQTVRVLRPDAVKVLAVSRDLATLDPDRQGILAVTFSFGRGKILHLVGHFDNNSLPFLPLHLPDPAPIIGIGLRQAMAANFVIAGLERANGH
ncbi:MAG: hypothetical protein K2Y39_03445 [Candidatus Obscuribacterales bacterium]|nr:hypothetical protein [Candidatus Obscuribacterales bacterium]